MNKLILNLAIPNVITNITVPLLGMADTAIAGHLESELYIGAIAVATVIFNFIYWNFSFLRMGTSGFTAQACGAGNERETVNVLLKALSVAASAGLIIILFQYFLLNFAFVFIKASPDTKIYISRYFYIYVWAAPFVLGKFAMSGWFIGMQDAKTPMFISIAMNIINIALSVFFVFGLKMGLKGLALGTALAQFSGFAMAAAVWCKKYGYLKKYLSPDCLKSWDSFKPFFKVNGDIFLRSLGIILVTTFFAAAGAKMGDMTLAVNSLIMQLFILFSYIMDGLAFAAEALAGKYYGAKDYAALAKIIRRIFVWGLGMTLAFTLIYALFTDGILYLLTNKTNIIETAKNYKFWALLFPLAGFAAFLWDGVFIGLTASRQMRNAVFASAAFFFIIYYSLSPALGNNALWLAFVSYLALRGVILTLLYGRLKKGFYI